MIGDKGSNFVQSERCLINVKMKFASEIKTYLWNQEKEWHKNIEKNEGYKITRAIKRTKGKKK